MGRILIVDDSPEFLTFIASVMKRTRHSVVTVTDGRDALEKIERDNFDLILTDVNMPGGVSGFDLVKTIRAIPGKELIPIAFITGRKDKIDIQKGLDFGADDYIVKPLDSPLFLSKIESLLSKSSSLQIKFAEGYVSMNASWDSEIRILHITEKGMTLWSDLKPPLDAIIRLKSNFFQNLGIEPPPLRVMASYDDISQLHRYFIKVGFIGLNDAELQKIRVWVNTHIAA